MNKFRRWWMGLLLCSVLAACVTTQAGGSGGERCEQASGVTSFAEACEAEASLLALCDLEQCGLYQCREVVPHLTAGQVVLARGGIWTLPGSQGNARRYRGNAQKLPRDSRPVFIIPWGPRPPPELLPSQKLLLEEQKAQRSKPYEMHHVFPQEFKEWFAQKGIDIHQYTMPLEVEEHRRIHRGERGGPWNAAWRRYIRNNDGALKPEIEKYAGQLIYEFRLYGILVPYGQRMWQTPPLGGK